MIIKHGKKVCKFSERLKKRLQITHHSSILSITSFKISSKLILSAFADMFRLILWDKIGLIKLFTSNFEGEYLFSNIAFALLAAKSEILALGLGPHNNILFN